MPPATTCCHAYGRQSYFVQSSFDGTNVQIGYDEHPGNQLYVFIYEGNPQSSLTCLDSNMAYMWPNGNGSGSGYMGCEGPATSFLSSFNNYSWGEALDGGGQLQLIWNGTELGYYGDGSSPGIYGQYYLSEIGDAGSAETMQQLLGNMPAVQFYNYYGGIWWASGGQWNQFTTPFNVQQDTLNADGTHSNGNPYCPPLGQAASVTYANDYEDMTSGVGQSTHCPGYNQSVPPNP